MLVTSLIISIVVNLILAFVLWCLQQDLDEQTDVANEAIRQKDQEIEEYHTRYMRVLDEKKAAWSEADKYRRRVMAAIAELDPGDDATEDED